MLQHRDEYRKITLRGSFQKHPFHLTDRSPWPFLTSVCLLFFLIGAVMFMHMYRGGWYLFKLGLIYMLPTIAFWFRDIIREATFEGHHTRAVQRGLKIGMSLFILSEVMFFFAFFWAFFHSSLVPAIQIGCVWPPEGIEVINPWGLPFLNTMILLLSGASTTWAHYAFLAGERNEVFKALIMTISLGLLFTFIQYYEYVHASFTISDGVYGSIFYMTTGFHGLHVLIGTIFLTVCLGRHWRYHFTRTHHLGFVAAAWYWHFVDVVWLFLFICIYWWGGK